MTLTAQFLKNLQRFRLVTFDVTDTLLYLKDPVIQYKSTAADHGIKNLDEHRMQQCFRYHFKQMSLDYPIFGKDIPDLSWQQWWIKLVINVFQCVDKNISANVLNKIANELILIYHTRACWTHIECGIELVENVRKAGKCVGVISNFDPSLSKILYEMNLIDKFDFILTSYDVGYEKPNSKIFQIPIKRLKINASEALHIGNKYSIDYIGAKKSGWSSLLIHKSPGNIINIEPSQIYANLKDLVNALETTNINW